jgi:uncharacterized repeat protein (TIGR03803 family)
MIPHSPARLRKNRPRFTSLFAIWVSFVILLLGPVASAQTFTILYSFAGSAAGDGAYPLGPLTMDTAGNIYGTTFGGGASRYGTVFELDSTGHESVLYSFSNGTDGGSPYGGVVRDLQGNLYGTTYQGGIGVGTVFELESSGHESVLFDFPDYKSGGFPTSSLVRDSSGNLYGVTTWGGCCSQGVVFKVTPSGTETVLHNFTAGADGQSPTSPLVLDAAGNLYGSTYSGGSHTPYCTGCGTVYKLDTKGNLTELDTLIGGQDGQGPGPVVRDAVGNVYVPANQGGANGYGIVYKVAANGKETALYNFSGGANGDYPLGLVWDTHGNLFGIAGGGTNGYGMVFKIDSSGNESALYSFTGNVSVNAHLIVDSAGNLYGTAEEGGSFGYGMIFKLTP